MTSEEIKKRAEKLRREIEYHNYRYYVLDNPIIPDNEYDKFFRDLKNLEERYPELRVPHSPTQRIGGRPSESFQHRKHTQPMFSLDNAFNLKEWNAYFQRIQKILPDEHLDFWTEPKMDGLAVEAIYENGIFQAAITRGDGYTGEDVTANMRTVRNMPLQLFEIPFLPEYLEVRGEVIIFIDDFKKLNQFQIKNDKRPFANPRNAAAGSVRQLDPRITAQRPLRFLVYGIGYTAGNKIVEEWTTQEKIISGLGELGFTVTPEGTLCRGPNEVAEYYRRISGIREDFPYEIDGVVAKVNDIDQQKRLGSTARAPRWALAVKFKSAQAETVLEDIQVQVGRTGSLTPVARLSPVMVGGVKVSRATLHNEDEIRYKDLKIGDKVIVQRAGDVIPEVVRPIPEKRDGSEKEFYFPETCPVCNSKVSRLQGEAAYRCLNLSCPAILLQSLIHFVSKAGLDIEGIGRKWIEVWVNHGLIKTPSDLFKLKKEDLLPLERMGPKQADNMLNALKETPKKATLEKLISALGIRMVGGETSKLLARHYRSLDELSKATREELQQIEDIGPEIADSIHSFFLNDQNRLLLKEFKEVGLWPVSEGFVEESQEALPLKDKRFVFTGKLKTLTRSQASELVEQYGGKVVNSVSRQLDYLVAGQEPGSKLDKAKELGIEVLDENQFKNLLT